MQKRQDFSTFGLQAEKCGVRIHFGHQLTSADFDEGTLIFKADAGETKVKVWHGALMRVHCCLCSGRL